MNRLNTDFHFVLNGLSELGLSNFGLESQGAGVRLAMAAPCLAINRSIQCQPGPPAAQRVGSERNFGPCSAALPASELPDGLLLLGPASITKAIKEYLLHYHHERPHQGLGNRIPFPVLAHPDRPQHPDQLQRKSRLGGLLNSYYWQGQSPLTSAA